MKICFVVPKYQRKPVGGYKIVFEYANRLVKDGHQISVLFMNSDILEHYNKLPASIVRLLAKTMTEIEPRWYKLDKRVFKYSNMEEYAIKKIMDSDAIIATALGTVDYAFSLSSTARKGYLIQDYENWNGFNDEDVIATYKTDSIKIVISEWLKRKVDLYSPTPSILIKNPIDLDIYKPIVPFDKREHHSVGILYHTSEHKGFYTGWKVLQSLKESIPDLIVYMFGGYKPDFDVPPWVHFTYKASQMKTVDIYNKCRVFLCTSRQEGFGLTGYEAIACGCVLVSTNYEGVHEYAIDNYNALLAPVDDLEKIKERINQAFDNQIAQRILSNGRKSLEMYSWDKAIRSFIEAIQ